METFRSRQNKSQDLAKNSQNQSNKDSLGTLLYNNSYQQAYLLRQVESQYEQEIIKYDEEESLDESLQNGVLQVMNLYRLAEDCSEGEVSTAEERLQSKELDALKRVVDDYLER